MINCLHHFEVLTNTSAKLIKYLVNGFNFNLLATNQTPKYNQYFVNANSINFLITSLNENDLREARPKETRSRYLYNSSLDYISHEKGGFADLLRQKKNTVFNAAFQVRDLDRVLNNCRRHDVKILKNKHVLYDEERSQNGYVECAVIESCVDGVIHSLFEMNDYKGVFLPGFDKTDSTTTEKKHSHLSHFDHLTYATFKNTSNHVIEWYRKVFNMRRFKLSVEGNDGLIVKTGESGMNLKVINYWLCAETGVEMSSEDLRDGFKFVISEPFGDEGAHENARKNQISIFLEEHGGPGIQHIGFATNDIFKTVQETKASSEKVKYYATPDTYYQMPNKIEEIKNCGLDLEKMRESHVLLDSESDDLPKNSANYSNNESNKKFLLQVFTQPIFDRNTLFLELIQRVGDVQGFGAGNIKALWNAVEYQLNLKQNN